MNFLSNLSTIFKEEFFSSSENLITHIFKKFYINSSFTLFLSLFWYNLKKRANIPPPPLPVHTSSIFPLPLELCYVIDEYNSVNLITEFWERVKLAQIQLKKMDIRCYSFAINSFTHEYKVQDIPNFVKECMAKFGSSLHFYYSFHSSDCEGFIIENNFEFYGSKFGRFDYVIEI